ncbi:MAG: ABC transporter permease subunit, partial [Lachnospiraceae bacterium]|nr:ABC transporter permease subunit [Lachnospiraceae bacterium]
MSVDRGQFEAGRSLGLNYKKTMTLIILPQALKTILPALLNEVISLLKETSISGYIGLMDLTKGGDIIRSNTYEAFLPLIAVALIYLALVMLLSHGVSKLERKMRKNER